MSWHNAPTLRKLTASQQGGNRGAQLWGVDIKGSLYTTYQTTPGGDWSNWLGPDWNGKNFPKGVYELAACQRHDGTTQLWVLDMKRDLWSTWQTSPGGNWNGWQAKWNPPPGNFRFKKISAAQLNPGGNQPARFWGITEDGVLTSCSQIVPAGNWSPWNDWAKTPENSRWLEISACKQGNNTGVLFGIDDKLQLWCMFQKAKGGDWGPWQGPNWNNAPKVRNIAAVEMANQKGGCIWIITHDYKFYQSTQSSPGGPEWWPWRVGDFKESLLGYEITAGGQNNGFCQVWGISLKQDLHTQHMIKSSPPDWEWFWTPEPPDAPPDQRPDAE